MNWVLMTVRNCLQLTQEALRSILEQTLPVTVWIINQGSEDGTPFWLNSLRNVVWTHHYPQFRALASAWNFGLETLFRERIGEVLVVNNDVVLRPDTFERLHQQAGLGFVTAVSMDDRAKVFAGEVNEDRIGKRPHPDFSCFLITRQTFWRVGPFDPHFIPAFREDQDYHWRMRLTGVDAVCIDVPFYHVGSATVKNNPADAQNVALFDSKRKEYYVEKWGALWPAEVYRKPFDGKPHCCDLCAK